MTTAFGANIKKMIFEAEVGKTEKGYVRIATFSTKMSKAVMNFGLKLYNLQNLQEITELIGPSPPKLNFQKNLDELDYVPIVNQKKTIWDPMNEINQGVAKRKLEINRNYDHTEFDLMRLLYGEDEGWFLMFKVMKDEKIQARYAVLLDENMDLNVKAAHKSLKQANKADDRPTKV